MKGKILAGSIGLALIALASAFFLLRGPVSIAELPPGSIAGSPPRHGDMAQFQAHTVPQPVPPFNFLDSADQQVDSSSFKGKITLVNLWATWCAPCVKEMPSLQALKQQKDSDRFTVVTMSQDHAGRDAVTKFFAGHNLTVLPADLDTSMAASSVFKIRGLPTTILLDEQGRELGRFEGAADWSGPDAVRLIDWYLGRQ